jgi:hypothetical protein
MKKNVLFQIIAICFVSISFLTGCGKKTEEKIVGKWEMAWMTKNENPTLKIIWDIKSNNNLVQTTTVKDSTSSYTISTVEGSYKFEKQAGSKFIRIYDIFAQKTFNGKYKILKVTKEILAIEEREDNEGEYEFNHIEFTRIN